MIRSRYPPKPWRRYWWLAGWLVLTGHDVGPSLAGSYGEYDVKAAIVFKLAKFIAWPRDAFDDDPRQHTICVVGRGPMGAALEQVLRGTSIGGRRVHVRQGVPVEELSSCQVVFISSSDARELARIKVAVADRPILLVGEAPCFTTRGGMVLLFVDDARVRFEINRERAEAAGLVIDPNLLRLSQSPGPQEECERVSRQ